MVAALVLTFLTFGSLDYYVLLSKHQRAEHIMHRYLQRMSVEGYLSAADEQQLRADFAAIGCPVEDLEGQLESRGDARVLRNAADVDASTVRLLITARPEPEPMIIGRIIGGRGPDAAFKIKVGGEMLSERVSP